MTPALARIVSTQAKAKPLLMQLLHPNSQHRALAKQYGQNTVLGLWGTLKKIPQRLLDALRYYYFAETDFALETARSCHIALEP
jgi:hypothetical protein